MPSDPLEVIYSKHCGCCPPAGNENASGIRWRELSDCWEEAIRLGIRRPPALLKNGRIVAQGLVAAKLLRSMQSGR